MKKKIIAHDFNLDIQMYKLDDKILSRQKYLKKKFIFKDVKKLSNKDKENITVFWGNRLNLKSIKQFKNLKYIHLGSKGINDDLKEYINNKKIKYTLSKKIFVEPIVASILATIFCSSRGINLSYMLRKRNNLDRKQIDKYKNFINNVFDENFLLVGYGEINKKLSKILKLFTKNITIINRSRIKNSKLKTISELKNLQNAVKNKKFIINTLPLTKETKNIFNAKIFRNFSNFSTFINYGRGNTVNTKDLIFYSKKKNLTICLDVFDSSQYINPYKPFKKQFYFNKDYKNIITPHIGSYDNDYWEKQVLVFYQNLKKMINII